MMPTITKTPNIAKLKRIHFIGIGGAGMSGIAEVLVTQGFSISGSDVAESSVTKHLQKLGAKILFGHDSTHVNGAEMVVYSTIIAKDNPEIIAAQQANIPIVARAQMLAELMKSRYGIAIAGTHGKTTTTSLVATLLAEGGLDPTFVIGGLLRSAGTNARLGASQYFVAEADESDGSFLFLSPQIIVITNIDADHLSTYSNNFAILKEAFVKFIHLLPQDGLVVLCSDDPIVMEILPQIKRPYLTYGFNKLDAVRAQQYQQNETRCQINVERAGHNDLNITLNLPGRHNVLNALAAITVATHCGVSDAAIAAGLEKFQGAGRRFQLYGELNFAKGKVMVVDDYGHHPREIAATLAAARAAWPQRRLILAFQPHRYTRTQELFNDFVTVLSQPDGLILLDIYAAGEKPIPGITGQVLYEAIGATGKVHPVVFVEKLAQLPQMLPEILQDGDVLLLQGAGDIGKIAPKLAELIKKAA